MNQESWSKGLRGERPTQLEPRDVWVFFFAPKMTLDGHFSPFFSRGRIKEAPIQKSRVPTWRLEWCSRSAEYADLQADLQP